MRRRHFFASALMLVGSLAAGACSDSPTRPIAAPFAHDSGSGSDGDGYYGGDETVNVLRRTTPLATDEVVTRVVGRAGGTIVLPRAGLTLEIPADALRKNTAITVTAPAGDLVGYHFAPHGLQFRKPVIATQQLDDSQMKLLTESRYPAAAYFEGRLERRVEAKELIYLNVWGPLNVACFDIDHFSGYVIATD
jgi:hypothetical protein